jgi:hypothetical protein
MSGLGLSTELRNKTFFFIYLFFPILLGIFFIYISNAIPKVPHTLPLLPTHSHFLALAFPCTEAYKVCKTAFIHVNIQGKGTCWVPLYLELHVGGKEINALSF